MQYPLKSRDRHSKLAIPTILENQKFRPKTKQNKQKPTSKNKKQNKTKNKKQKKKTQISTIYVTIQTEVLSIKL